MKSEFRGADPAEGCRLDAGDAFAEPSAVFIRRAEVATLYYSTTVRNPKARLVIRVEKAMRWFHAIHQFGFSQRSRQQSAAGGFA
jgi:hypothetical protein